MSRSTTCRRSTRRSRDNGLATANAGLVTDIIACPGLDYCALANARSIPIAQRISERFGDHDAAEGDRRAQDQDLRLHQRLRPPSCRPHRHSRRREEGRGVLPAHARRLGRRARLDRRDHRPRLLQRRGGRCCRDARRYLSEGSRRARTRISSPPIAGSARSRSRKRSMALLDALALRRDPDARHRRRGRRAQRALRPPRRP